MSGDDQRRTAPDEYLDFLRRAERAHAAPVGTTDAETADAATVVDLASRARRKRAG